MNQRNNVITFNYLWAEKYGAILRIIFGFVISLRKYKRFSFENITKQPMEVLNV